MNKDASSDEDLLDQPTCAGPVDKAGDDGASKPDAGEHGFATIGSLVGQYELLGEIARGAMGVVYRARHEKLGRLAAIKMILNPDAVGKDIHERFETEAKAAATLDHPGIVALFESGRWNGYPYFAMAYVDGHSMLDRLRGGPFTASQSAKLAESISQAMAHAHGRQIIHRDLKPANILIDADGNPHITDFGVCKDLTACSELTTAGEMVGTPHYMPPEQAGMAGAALGPTADVYSIGAVLFTMLTGRPPFLAATPVEVVSQVLTQDPVSPQALNASVPIELSTITLKCLRKNTHQRYRDAGELADDLGRFIRGEPIEARPPGVTDKIRLLLQRHVFVASVSSTAALALLAMMIFVFVSLVRTRNELAVADVELEKAQSQLKSERMVVNRFLRSRSSLDPQTDRDAIIHQFEMNRLVDAHTHVAESNPELALQLAVEAAKWSLTTEIDLPPQVFEYLRERAGAPRKAQTKPTAKPTAKSIEGEDTAKAPSPLPTPSRDTTPPTAESTDSPSTDKTDQGPLSLEQLIKKAEQNIIRPMSQSDRRLFGLPTDDDTAPEEVSR